MCIRDRWTVITEFRFWCPRRAGSSPVARSLQVDQDTAEGVDIGLLMSAEERKLPGALFFDVLDHFKPGVFIQPDVYKRQFYKKVKQR